MPEKDNFPVRFTSNPPKSVAKVREERKKKLRKPVEKPKTPRRAVDVRCQKIPLPIRPILVALHSNGMSYRKIASLLRDTYGIEVTRNAVYYHIKRFRQVTNQKL